MTAIGFWVSISTIFGFVVNITLVQPAFESMRLAKNSLDLAEWTALKDFRENCRTMQVGVIFQDERHAQADWPLYAGARKPNVGRL